MEMSILSYCMRESVFDRCEHTVKNDSCVCRSIGTRNTARMTKDHHR